MDTMDRYFDMLVAAFVRGSLAAARPSGSVQDHLWQCPLADLSPDDVEQLVRVGQQAGLRLHRFKRTMDLPAFGAC